VTVVEVTGTTGTAEVAGTDEDGTVVERVVVVTGLAGAEVGAGAASKELAVATGTGDGA